jgi:hypothetical protein
VWSPSALTAVLGLGVAGFLLWLPALGTWYWIDEALSIGLAEQPLGDITGSLVKDGSPPLWYLALHAWVELFGTGEVATHALSVVFALAAIPVAWWAGVRVGGRRVALTVSVLVTLSPFLAYFAHETRMYTLVVVEALVVVAAFIAAFVDRRPRAEVGFVAASVVLLYTHNWGLYTMLASLVALVVVASWHDDGRAVLRRGLRLHAIVGLAFLPWVPMLVGQLRDTGAPWSFTPDARDVVRELAALVRDERVLVVLLLAAGGGLLSLRARWRSREATVAAVLAAFAVVPVVIGWLAAQVEPSWATRYLAVVLGPMLLLVAIGIVRSGAVGGLGLGIAVVLLLQPLTRIQGNLEHPEDAKSNAAELADELGPALDTGDVVVVAQPEAVPLFHHYLGDHLRYADPSGFVAQPAIMDWRDAEERLDVADPDVGLQPLLETLDEGDRLLLVIPSGGPRPTDTEWVTTFRRLGSIWRRTLLRDDRLAGLDAYRPEEDTVTPYSALLFERR